MEGEVGTTTQSALTLLHPVLFATFIDRTWSPLVKNCQVGEYDGGHKRKDLGLSPINNAPQPVPQNKKAPPVSHQRSNV